MEKVVSKFLQFLKVPISKRLCEKLILSHPDYPSILSVADTLERFGVKYTLGRVGKEELNEIPFPFLLHLDKNGGELLFIQNRKDLKINKDNLTYWNGIILLAEPKEKIKDNENTRLRSKENFLKNTSLVLASSLILLTALFIVHYFSVINALLLTTSVAGLAISYLLFAKGLGINYEVVENFCNAGKKTNCGKIIGSRAGTVFRDIKLNDITITYFIFQIIFISVSILLPATSFSLLFILATFSFSTVPILLFSLYYQKYVAKVWCKLCLVLDVILAVQVGVFGYHLIQEGVYRIGEIDFLAIVISLLSFMVIGPFVLLVKGIIEEANKSRKNEIKLSRVVHSVAVFTNLLFQQKKIDTSSLFEQELLIGSPNASIKLTVVSNLHCYPCKEQHKKIAELIDAYPEKVNVAIRFSGSNKEVGSALTASQYILQYWLNNIHGTANESADTEKLIHNWYQSMDIETFSAKYPLISAGNEEAVKLEKQHFDWVHQSGIYKTPTIFINGYELPKDYNMENLMILIPGLVEKLQKPVTEFNGTALQNA